MEKAGKRNSSTTTNLSGLCPFAIPGIEASPPVPTWLDDGHFNPQRTRIWRGIINALTPTILEKTTIGMRLYRVYTVVHSVLLNTYENIKLDQSLIS